MFIIFLNNSFCFYVGIIFKRKGKLRGEVFFGCKEVIYYFSEEVRLLNSINEMVG